MPKFILLVNAYLFSAGIIAYFCPCYVFGKNAEAVGDSCLLCALSQFVPLLDIYARTSVRGKIREQKGIEVRQRAATIGCRFLLAWHV